MPKWRVLLCSGVVVKSELRWSVPCDNNDMQLVEGGGLGWRQAYHISLSKLIVKVGVVFPLACVADCCHVARSAGGCAQCGRAP
jgi:hypothetical protein